MEQPEIKKGKARINASNRFIWGYVLYTLPDPSGQPVDRARDAADIGDNRCNTGAIGSHHEDATGGVAGNVLVIGCVTSKEREGGDMGELLWNASGNRHGPPIGRN